MCFHYWGEQSREARRPGFHCAVTGCEGEATKGGRAVGLGNLKSTVSVCCWEPGDCPEDGQSLAGSTAASPWPRWKRMKMEVLYFQHLSGKQANLSHRAHFAEPAAAIPSAKQAHSVGGLEVFRGLQDHILGVLQF